MDTLKIMPQVEKLIHQIGHFVAPKQQGLLDGTNTMISIIFGYKLLELAMVSLCVTVKSKGLLPDQAVTQSDASLAHYATVLFEYGLIEQDMFEKLIRLNTAQPGLNQELLAISNSMNVHHTILEDIQHVLKGTENIVQEMCENGAAVA